MRSLKKTGVFRQAFYAFLFSFIFLLIVNFALPVCTFTPLCELPATRIETAAELAFESPTAYDSRVFLLPLQPFMQIFLDFIPFFASGNLSATILAIFFAAWVSGLFIIYAHHANIKPFFAWLFIIAYLTNLNTIQAIAIGSGVHILVFLLVFVYTFLAQWRNDRYWLALVWIGMGAALAVLSQFSAIFFLLLPVLAALIIAFREKPKNIYYTENALWIMLTPILYVFIIRFLFGFIMYGDPVAFFRIESGVLPALTNKQPIMPPVLPRIVEAIPAFCSELWLIFAPFTIISICSVGISIIKKNIFPAAFALMVWLPLVVLHASNNMGFYDPTLIIATFSAAITPILSFVSITPPKNNLRTIGIILISTLLFIWNIFDWIVVFNLAQ